MAKGIKLFRKEIKAMMTMLTSKKQNNQPMGYLWNSLIDVRPYSVDTTIAISANPCDFAGRLGHLEPLGRLRYLTT